MPQRPSANRVHGPALKLLCRRFDEPILDRVAVAAGDDARLIVGLDPRMDEGRPLLRVEHRSHTGRGIRLRNRYDMPKAAGFGRSGEIDSRGGVAHLHPGGGIVPVVEHNDRQVAGLFHADGGEAAQSHQNIAVTSDDGHAPIGTREGEPQADHRGATHPAPDIEIEGMIAASHDVKGRRAKSGDDQEFPAVDEKARGAPMRSPRWSRSSPPSVRVS
jgi:hypothetical protein